ncbi:unnamed protein product [Linum trigynum]|uniref:GRF-type domain-containing protein n=1 Tax=Linum trigynum TaxID=586398 RepID=A0AAV2DXI0_9ROSI
MLVVPCRTQVHSFHLPCKPKKPEKKESSNDIMCECGRLAVVRISRTTLNPNRKFFCCAKRGSKQVDKGCGLFEWFDIRMAIEKERHRLDALIRFLEAEKVYLKEKNGLLIEANKNLRKSVAQMLPLRLLFVMLCLRIP